MGSPSRAQAATPPPAQSGHPQPRPTTDRWKRRFTTSLRLYIEIKNWPGFGRDAVEIPPEDYVGSYSQRDVAFPDAAAAKQNRGLSFRNKPVE